MSPITYTWIYNLRLRRNAPSARAVRGSNERSKDSFRGNRNSVDICAAPPGRSADVAAPLKFAGCTLRVAAAPVDPGRNRLLAKRPFQGAFVDMTKDEKVGFEG